MFKLILVFGVWINPEYIVFMEDYSRSYDCSVHAEGSKALFKNKTCDQVVREINKQMKENKDV
tara:strand:+ start:1782 stop:1970 length:189 start_codon:yes stop_codon:yes gene_type:complete